MGFILKIAASNPTAATSSSSFIFCSIVIKLKTDDYKPYKLTFLLYFWEVWCLSPSFKLIFYLLFDNNYEIENQRR